MASFYEKLSAKLQGEEAMADAKDPPSTGAKSVSYNAAGIKTAAAPVPSLSHANAASDAPAEAPQPDGTDPLLIDLFQSEARMVIFVEASGIAPGDFEVIADEEANTLLIQATQKRPGLPALPGAASGAESEKGRFVKSEIKWSPLYRKVYLPSSFDVSAADTYLEHGVLVIALPVKKPGVGKKLSVRELKEEPKQ